MSAREALREILDGLPDDRVNEVLDFARFLTGQEERQAWRQFGHDQLARAYGPDEPDYRVEEVKPELGS
ncbi:MAG TPA: hypothetical protein VMY37_05575 [Thermoguttaceae bacterium]|nr:hypothetical protein [Thermoguttaceae bacterium]